jgi:hypothetical protein
MEKPTDTKTPADRDANKETAEHIREQQDQTDKAATEKAEKKEQRKTQR